jgi:tetratricopeptide (TPR) repeat protein
MGMGVNVLTLAMAGLTLWGPCLLAQAVPTSEQQIETHSRQAQEDLRINRPDLAIGEFKAILALDPNNVVAQGDLGALLYFQGDYKEAVEPLRSVVKTQPSLWNSVMLLGMCEKRLGNLTAARSNLEQAFPKLTTEKLRVQAGMELTELYYASRDLDSAADVLKVLRKLKPDDPAILYTAHRVYSEQADEAALSVAMLAPKSAWMHELIAEEMVVQGKNDAAILHYREALKIDDHLPGAHFELGEVLSSASSAANKDQAAKEYEAALKQNPFDEKSECRLGKIALGRSDLKEAYARYTRALQLQSDDPDANLGLGTVLVSMNEPQQALPLLETATKLDPSDAVAHYHLGTLYRKMGRIEDSRRELAEFQRLKQMKGDLKEVFRGMRLQNKLDDTDQPLAQ